MTSTATREQHDATLSALEYAERLLHAQAQADLHVEKEITEDIEQILETLSPEGPYAYTALPVLEDGHLVSRVAHDIEQIRQCYEGIHSNIGLRGWRSTTRLLSSWYTFHAGWAATESKEDGSMVDYEALVIFPTMGNRGITGELFWNRTSPGVTPRSGESSSDVRRRIMADQEAYLEAIRSGDAEGMLAAVAPDVQVNFRGYVNEQPGRLTELNGRDEMAAHIAQSQSRYLPETVDVVHLQIEDWYVFSEKLWTVKSVHDDTRLRYLTAEYAELAPDGKMIARIGHGTEPVAI